MPKDDATVCFETSAQELREQNTQEIRLNPAALLPDGPESWQRAQSNTEHGHKRSNEKKQEVLQRKKQIKDSWTPRTCCLQHKQHKEQKGSANLHHLCGFVPLKAFPGGKPTKGRESTPEQLKWESKRGLKFQQDVHKSFREGKYNKAWLCSNAKTRKTAVISCRLGTGGENRELGSSVRVYRNERPRR